MNYKVENKREGQKLYRLMNHDSSHVKPRYEVYTLDELNKQFETDYTSIDEAIDAEPEYLYREEEIKEHLRDKLTFERIQKNRESFEEAKETGYTHILEVDNRVYAIHIDSFDDSANEIAFNHGYKAYDSNSDKFMGCGFDDEQAIQIFLGEI